MHRPIKNLKFILIMSIMSLVLILGIVLVIFTRGNKKEVKNYQKLPFKEYTPKYKRTQDFMFENELTIPEPKENFYYRSGNTNQSQNFKDAANKLGLSKEATNPITKLYLWSKDENTQVNALNLNLTRGTVNLNYQDGINSEVVEGKDSYTYMSSFFNLNPLDSTLLYETKSDETATTFTFKQNHLGKDIYFDQGIDGMSNIRMKAGRITEFYSYITTKNLTKGTELKPITIVSNANIESLTYFMNFQPSNTVATSLYGAETQFITPVSILMKESSEVFYYRVDGNSFILYPAIKISGEYIDNKNHKGTVTIVIINQDPSYQPVTR